MTSLNAVMLEAEEDMAGGRQPRVASQDRRSDQLDILALSSQHECSIGTVAGSAPVGRLPLQKEGE